MSTKFHTLVYFTVLPTPCALMCARLPSCRLSMWRWQVCGQLAVNPAVGCMQERQRKLEQEVAVVAEEEPVPEPTEPVPPLKQPSGPLTLAQVAAANVPEVEAPADAVVSTLLLHFL